MYNFLYASEEELYEINTSNVIEEQSNIVVNYVSKINKKKSNLSAFFSGINEIDSVINTIQKKELNEGNLTVLE